MNEWCCRLCNKVYWWGLVHECASRHRRPVGRLGRGVYDEIPQYVAEHHQPRAPLTLNEVGHDRDRDEDRRGAERHCHEKHQYRRHYGGPHYGSHATESSFCRQP